MSKRYLLDRIVGTGTREDPFRPGVRGLPGINVAAVIPTGPDGRPTRDTCLARVGGLDLAAALTSPGVDAFPDFPLDVRMQAMSGVTRNQLEARLVARGFGGNLVGTADSFRDLIRGVGQSLDPGFAEDSFDVSEIPLAAAAARAGKKPPRKKAAAKKSAKKAKGK